MMCPRWYITPDSIKRFCEEVDLNTSQPKNWGRQKKNYNPKFLIKQVSLCVAGLAHDGWDRSRMALLWFFGHTSGKTTSVLPYRKSLFMMLMVWVNSLKIFNDEVQRFLKDWGEKRANDCDIVSQARIPSSMQVLHSLVSVQTVMSLVERAGLLWNIYFCS